MKKNTFPERLKTLLDQKALTLAQVARAIGTSAPSVHRWTHGGEIEYENLRALATFLEVNWIWLRYGDEAVEGLRESLSSNGFAANERRKYLGEIMENEARMNLAQEMAHIVTWEWNILTDELTISPNSEQIFGQSIEEVHPYLLPFKMLDFDELKVRFTGSNLTLEWDFSLIPTQGEGEYWFASRGKLILDAQERPCKVIAVSIDITQRKKMEKALEHSEYMLRKVMETIPVGLFIADESGKISIINPEAERIWGEAKLVELANYSEYKGWWDSTGKQVGKSGWTLARAIEKGETSQGEVVNIEAFDGELRTIIMSAIPLLDVNNKIMGAIEVNQDITALKREENTFKVIVEQWDSIFDQPLVGIAYHKVNDDSLHVNARFAEIMHRTIEDLAKDRLENLLDENTRRLVMDHLIHTQLGSAENHILQGKLQCKSRELRDVRICILANTLTQSVFKTLIFAF